VSVLLDSFALIAYLRDEPAAAAVQQRMWAGDVSMSAVQLAEVADRMVRVYGAEDDEVEVIVSALEIAIVPVDQSIGARAGALRARHYGATGRTLSLADAVCIATALDTGRTVLTADPVLLEVLAAEHGSAEQLPGTGA
jgi:PIN domain nuclease of toxin-antitoxin system